MTRKKIYQNPKPEENLNKVAPSIEEQIEYIKDRVACLNPKFADYQNDLDMLRTIEVTLIAAKHLA